MIELNFFARWGAVAFGLLLAAGTLGSIAIPGGILSLVAASFLLTGAQLVVRPLLVLVMLPLVVVTLGAAVWVINALLVMAVTALVPGYEVAGWGGGFWAALLVSLSTLTAMLLSTPRSRWKERVTIRVSPSQRTGYHVPGRRPRPRDDDDVIDI